MFASFFDFNTHRFFSLIALSFLFSACGKLPDYEVNSAAYGFSVSGEVNPRIDILFVVDNSGSMSGNQTILSDSLSGFMDAFSQKDLEFHIGVTTTDQYCNSDVHSVIPGDCASHWSNSSGTYNGIYNNRYGSLLSKTSGEKFLTWTTLDFVNKFEQNVLLGVGGDGSEMPVMGAIKALTSPLSSGWNAGFIREDSFLAVIMVTDEDETAAVGAQTKLYNSGNLGPMNARIDQFTAAVQAIKGPALSNFRLAVIAQPPSASSCAGSAEKAYGLDYMVTRINTNFPPGVAELPKASFASICSNFATALADIGEAIVLSNARISLVQSPANAAEMVVSNGAIVLPRNTTNGWQYYEVGNYVQFYGTAIPNVGDQIVINYTPADPI